MDDSPEDPLEDVTFQEWVALQDAWWAIIAAEWPGHQRREVD